MRKPNALVRHRRADPAGRGFACRASALVRDGRPERAGGFKEPFESSSGRWDCPPYDLGAVMDERQEGRTGSVHDQRRIDYMRTYVKIMRDAVEIDGVAVRPASSTRLRPVPMRCS